MRCPRCKGLVDEARLIIGAERIIGMTCPTCGWWKDIIPEPKINHFPGPLEGRPEPTLPGYKGDMSAREYFRYYNTFQRIKKLKQELAALEAL